MAGAAVTISALALTTALNSSTDVFFTVTAEFAKRRKEGKKIIINPIKNN